MVMVFASFGLENIVEAKQSNNIDLNLKGVDLRDAFRAIAEVGGMNVITDSSVSGDVTINLKEIPFLEAIELLARTNTLDYKIINNTILIGTKEGLEAGFGNKVTEVYILEHAEPEEVKETLNLLVDDSSIRVDERTKSIIVTTYESKLGEIEHIVKSLDVSKKQVALQVRVMELNYNLIDELGMNWRDGRIFGNSESEEFEFRIGGLTIDKKGISYDSFFRALETNAMGSTLANPQITTIDGKVATINVGDEVPIVNVDEEGNPQVDFKDVGVNLEIRTRLIREGEVMIDLKPEVSSINEWVETGGMRYPQVTTKRAETTVRVNDGETFALGGLISEEELENIRKVPVLGDIPLLGRLFRSKRIESSKRELVIFITPEIIKDQRVSIDEVIEDKYMDIFSYEVSYYDTLWGIGELFGISYLDLMDYNNIEDISKVEVGRVLSIPVDKRQYYRVEDGDTLKSIVDEYNISKSQTIRINNLVSLDGMVGQEILLPLVID